jgi:SAM-dependent methyltransferase
MRSRPLLVTIFGVLLAACGGPAAPPAAPPDAAGHAGHHHGGGPLVHRFDGAEGWSKEFDDPARDAWQKPAEVVALLELRPGMTVADVGAGTGYFLPYLSRAVGPSGAVLALDIEPDMVRFMRERAAREGLANVRSDVVRGDDPGLPQGKVDRVLIVDTWHHIPERAAYAARLRAGLAPGGRVAIVDFTMEAQHGPPKMHRIPPEQVVAELAAGGLAASIVPETLPEQYVVVGTLPGPAAPR